MAKAKKLEKRSAPKKAVKVVPKSKYQEGDYAKLADAIMNGIPKPTKPQPPPKNAYIEKMGKPRPTAVSKKPPEPEAPKIEITVRSVYYDGQFLPALCFRKPGAMHVPCVAGDSTTGVRKFTIPASQHDKSTVVQNGFGVLAVPYPPDLFAKNMRRIAAGAPVSPEARTLLLPYVPDMPLGPLTVAVPAPDPEALPVPRRIASGTGSRPAAKAPSGPARTSGKELIRTLAAAAGLPPEKVRAKLRSAGMRAPYTSEADCKRALGLK